MAGIDDQSGPQGGRDGPKEDAEWLHEGISFLLDLLDDLDAQKASGGYSPGNSRRMGLSPAYLRSLSGRELWGVFSFLLSFAIYGKDLPNWKISVVIPDKEFTEHLYNYSRALVLELYPTTSRKNPYKLSIFRDLD